MCFNGNCHDNICTTYGSCVGLLSTQVFVIMVSRVLLGNVSESKGVIRSLFQQCCCGSCCKKKQTKSLAEQHGYTSRRSPPGAVAARRHLCC